MVKKQENDNLKTLGKKKKNTSTTVGSLKNEVAGLLTSLNEEKRIKLKQLKVVKEDGNKVIKKSSKKSPGGVKKKSSKPFSKFQPNSSSHQTNSNHPVAAKPASVFDDLLLPTQQLVSSFLPWFEVLSNEPTGKVDNSFKFVNDLKRYATKLLELETERYQKGNKKMQKDINSSKWVKTAASAGTTKDRFHALTVLSQEAPFHNLRNFETLLNMTKKNIKRDTMQGVNAIKDVLLKSLLPQNRRLRNFDQHPLHKVYAALTSKGEETPTWSLEKCQQFLIVWAFEEKLKLLIKEFIGVLSELSKDQMIESKKKAVHVACTLLKRKPEGESEFLKLIVNKLGDPHTKVASYTLHMLHTVADEHVMMQTVIVRAVRDLLLTPNLSERAQYYCVCYLTAQMLGPDKKELSEALLKIYMSFFKALVHKNENRDSASHNRMMSELLAGVSRALPFAHMNQDVMKQIDELYRATHHPRLNTAVRAYCILFQVLEVVHENADRFYNSFYKSLIHPELALNSSRHTMYLNLLFRALKFDSCESRRDAFVKRALQVTTLHGPAFSAALLTLISELMRFKPVFAQRLLHTPVKKKEEKKLTMFEDDGDGEEHFYDVDEDDGVAKKRKNESQVKSSWIHKSKQAAATSKGSERDYDPTYLNPQYCGAEKAAFWELHLLTRHYHPTVAFYAQTLLTPGAISKPFSGDPLTDYALVRFLERFVYRNPKSEPEIRKYYSVHSRSRFVSKSHRYDIPANTTKFLEKKRLLPEDLFFHKYFSQPSVQKRHRKKKKQEEKGEDDHQDLSDDEFDEFINSAEGQKEVDKEIKFFDHVSKDSSTSKKPHVEFDDSDDDDMDEEVEEQDEEELPMEEEDQSNSAGVFITGGNESKKRKGKETKTLKPKKRKMIGNKLGDILAENALSEFDTISSSATIVTDKSSAKQLKWENKQEKKALLEKKRARMRNKSDKKVKQTKGQFKGKKAFTKSKKQDRVKKSKK